jgi:hypothetical protein
MEGVGGAPECEALDAMDRTWYRGMYGDKGLKTKVRHLSGQIGVY